VSAFRKRFEGNRSRGCAQACGTATPGDAVTHRFLIQFAPRGASEDP
jgi:hypothetical protein